MNNVNLGNFYLSNQCQSVKSVAEKSVFFSCLLVVNFPSCLSGLVAKLLRALRNQRQKTVFICETCGLAICGSSQSIKMILIMRNEPNFRYAKNEYKPL